MKNYEVSVVEVNGMRKVRLQVGNQGFTIAHSYGGNDAKSAEWMADMLRKAMDNVATGKVV